MDAPGARSSTFARFVSARSRVAGRAPSGGKRVESHPISRRGRTTAISPYIVYIRVCRFRGWRKCGAGLISVSSTPEVILVETPPTEDGADEEQLKDVGERSRV